MRFSDRDSVKVAILDMYEGVENQGMRCIREILDQYAEYNNLDLVRDEFDVRRKMEIPDLSYDVYISSGGPGSPIDSEGTEWENRFFDFIKNVEDHNAVHSDKKQIFFICHSFQLACRYFKTAEVSKRKSTAFGVFPVHYLNDAAADPIFRGLYDPFYVVDSRDYQVTKPNDAKLNETRGGVLAIEKERPHVPLDRAVMAMRFNEFMVGTQFHPEADAVGMSMYLQKPDKKQTVIENHGEDKWKSMITQLSDPDKILHTYSHVLPNFLNQALAVTA